MKRRRRVPQLNVILQLLVRRNRVKTATLLKVARKYTARICELRKEGFQIACECNSRGRKYYRLTNYTAPAPSPTIQEATLALVNC